ncbi:MAG TPA: glycosyltransferase family 1 protein [Planctomycetota bacterium]|nr:glycosyltransferase family 1 protein [Planctomycetota bacterium]
MLIAIVPCLNRSLGGQYQYSQTMLDAVRAMLADGRLTDRFVVVAEEADAGEVRALRERGWEVRPFPPISLTGALAAPVLGLLGEGCHRAVRGAFRRLRAALGRSRPAPAGAGAAEAPAVSPRLHAWFGSLGVELALYPMARDEALLAGIPFVASIHDLQHRLQPEFPEVSAGSEWAGRERLYAGVARSAELLLADSEVGREDILACYGAAGAEPGRVMALPFLPGPGLAAEVSAAEVRRVREARGLPERYLFYPAQFWPHKNHLRIIEALGRLRREAGLEVCAAFCGSHSGELRERTFAAVREEAARLGLGGAVRHLGYVPDAEMAALYAGAVALVMPTFFGPTNIPVLEAWALGCPVITSDIRGIREQCGDAAVLVDPRSAESIAGGIRRVWTDEALRRDLAEKGRRRRSAYTFGDYCARLRGIIEEAKARVRG